MYDEGHFGDVETSRTSTSPVGDSACPEAYISFSFAYNILNRSCFLFPML